MVKMFIVLLVQVYGLSHQSQDQLSLLNWMADTTWAVNDFVDGRVFRRHAMPRDIKEIRIIDQALNDHNFYFNPRKDTILLCIRYPEIVHPEYLPLEIDAFSSSMTIHLHRDAGKPYQAYDESNEKNGYMSNEMGLIRQDDLDGFSNLYSQQGGELLDAEPCHVFRIEIKRKRIKSVSEWRFYPLLFL